MADGDTPLDRQGKAATALRTDDPELARIRVLLADLRPDCADPFEPPVEQPAQVPHIAIRDPSAAWGGTPRGLESALGGMLDRAAEMEARCAADVLAEVDALPAPAPRVLRWLRGHASLGAGLRGLYVDAGVWAGATGDDLGARRDAAYSLGRRLVLRAADAWDSRGGA